MLYIENKTKAVHVLKAWGYKDLRIIPGMNEVPLEKEDLDRMMSSKAIQGKFDEKFLVMVRETDLTGEQLEQAKEARKKNDKLNQAKQVIGKKAPSQKANNQKLLDQEKTISEKDKQIKDLEKKLAKAEKAAKKD